ncbi:hypothetical protein CKAH01_18964 [Colletotrichum kahawae]|uniref:Uncharacterized protein n=1 Tax=Colletotrichum kahawae TaxID=34407 RepID=A0AAD9Y4E8_COLKA|nr:hypothetical protein CKAH01_18964 [Colletotrichum kahawae]
MFLSASGRQEEVPLCSGGLKADDAVLSYARKQEALVQDLRLQIETLQRENDVLREEEITNSEAMAYCVFHWIVENLHSDDISEPGYYEDTPNEDAPTYLSAPTWDLDNGELYLKAHSRVFDPQDYLLRESNVAFAVFKFYMAEHRQTTVRDAWKSNLPLPCPEPFKEIIQLVSGHMVAALRSFLDFRKLQPPNAPEVVKPSQIHSPFLWRYHRRDLDSSLLPQPQAGLMAMLLQWIDAGFSSLYEKADSQFERGVVSYDTVLSRARARPRSPALPEQLPRSGSAGSTILL